MAFLDLLTSRKTQEEKEKRLRLEQQEEERLARQQRERDAWRVDWQNRLEALRSQVKSEAIKFEGVIDQYTSKPEVRTAAAVQADIAAAEKSLADADVCHAAAVAELLPVEAALKRNLDEQHLNFKQKKNQELSKLRIELEQNCLDDLFPRINMDFLKRRKWSEEAGWGLPLFAVFDVNNPVCQLEAIARRRGNDRQTVDSAVHPKGFEEQFAEALSYLSAEARVTTSTWGSRFRAIKAEFSGAIPPDVRQIVRTYKNSFTGLYLVAEAPDWQVIADDDDDPDWVYRESFQAQPIQAGRDPLLIAEKHGTYWLLAAFDTTVAEEYVRREYTEGKLD